MGATRTTIRSASRRSLIGMRFGRNCGATIRGAQHWPWTKRCDEWCHGTTLANRRQEGAEPGGLLRLSRQVDTVGCDAAARVSNASYSLHRIRCSKQISQSRAHRSGMAVSFPLPSGDQNTTLQTRIHLTCWKKESIVLRVCSGWRACSSLLPSPFLLGAIFYCGAGLT